MNAQWNQFYRDIDGVWHFRAAEEHFKKLSIEYELKANSDLPAILVGNVRFLEDYSHASCPALTEAEVDAVQKPVVERRFMPMLEIMRSGVSADHIFKAIVGRHVYVDLESDKWMDPPGKSTRQTLRRHERRQCADPVA